MIEDYIYKKLSEDLVLQGLVGVDIYALRIDEKATNPTIVYNFGSQRSDSTITGCSSIQILPVNIGIGADSFRDAINIGSEVIRIIEAMGGDYQNINVQGTEIQDIDRLYDDADKLFIYGISASIYFQKI